VAPPVRGTRKPWGRSTLGKQQRSRTVDVSIVILLLLAFLLTMATYLFPVQLQKVEQEAAQEMDQLLHQQHFGQQMPIKGMPHGSMDSSESAGGIPKLSDMDSRWVDGEKKLKQALEVLVDRQRQGQDIGVPVLTRWLGDDIPVWPTQKADDPMPQDEWNQKVEAAYVKMREEEMEWRSQMTLFLEQDASQQGRG